MTTRLPSHEAQLERALRLARMALVAAKAALDSALKLIDGALKGDH